MSTGYNDEFFKLFTLNSNKKLAVEISNYIGVPLGQCTVSKWRNSN